MSLEEQVQRWRQEGTLPFPDFSWQGKVELRGTLDYSPEGSVLKADNVPK
ncbi:hypothetical protein KVP09_02055 [Alcaligenaceae bacterium CGII-47]|nr:hypothetical protein [Alcaligenaceae bacterium CGII-47]